MIDTVKTITIETLAFGGNGVGHIGEKVIFIPDSVPGDVVKVNIRQDKGSFLRGVIEQIETPSQERVELFCPYASRCGGCQWQHISYPYQLEWKLKIVNETLRRISGIDVPDAEPCLPSPIEQGSRSVVRYPAENTDDGLIAGYYKRRSHKIVDIDNCPVATEKINSAVSVIKEYFKEKRFSFREITFNASVNHESLLITITTNYDNDLEAPIKKLLSDIPGLAGVIHRLAPSKFLRSYGKHYRFEGIGDKLFRIEERSFFQTNVPQTERLVGLAAEMLDMQPSDSLVDGYGGVGLFSLSVAGRDNRINLYDMSRSAVKDRVANARQMKFTDFTAHRSDTVTAAKQTGRADLLIVDPPRTGLGRKAVGAACYMEPRTIAYISCNPSTLARDIAVFADSGYYPVRVVPVDMFPHTYHIETVVKLVKR